MLDQITNLIKDQAVKAFTEQTDIPNDQAENAAKATGISIFDTLKDQILSGDTSAITSLLSSGGSNNASNSIVQSVIGKLVGNLGNMGIGSDTAQSAANNVIPGLLQSVVGKFTSSAPADASFDANSLIQGIMQDAGKNMIQDALKDKLGGFGKLFG